MECVSTTKSILDSWKNDPSVTWIWAAPTEYSRGEPLSSGSEPLDNGLSSLHAEQTESNQQTDGGVFDSLYIRESNDFQRWRGNSNIRSLNDLIYYISAVRGAAKSVLLRDLHRQRFIWREPDFWRSFQSSMNSRVDKKSRVSTGFTSASREYFIEGDLNGNPIEALPDSGADMCFISPELASSLRLRPATGTQRGIKIANKKHVQSPGMVEIPWTFAREQRTYILKCWILPGCVQDLILGNDFLKMTETFTTFRNRIKSKLVELPRQFRLSLLGEETQRLWGFLDGHHTMALPDTGSDVMLISSTYAQRIGLTIDRNFENWLEIEFADGTTAWTSGVVRNVPWDVGGKTVPCDFHVLDDLCVDVILSKDYLFDLNVFSENRECFFNASPEDNIAQLCNIRLIGRYSDALDVLNEEFLEDMASLNAFGPEMIRRELVRRDLIRDEISALAESQRQAAIEAEAGRQLQWENLRQTYQARWRTASSASQSSGHSGTDRTERHSDLARASESPQIEVAGDCLHGPATRTELRKKKISLVSIPLRSLGRGSTRFLVRR